MHMHLGMTGCMLENVVLQHQQTTDRQTARQPDSQTARQPDGRQQTAYNRQQTARQLDRRPPDS